MNLLMEGIELVLEGKRGIGCIIGDQRRPNLPRTYLDDDKTQLLPWNQDWREG